jgi:glycosyltransferase involved in cell wall biosynthesis
MKNEANGFNLLFEKLLGVLECCKKTYQLPYEIVVINDGSTDNTLHLLLELQKSIPSLRVIDLSRNFGKEAALTAGLAFARGSAAIPIDADLQDQPELMIELIGKWLEGYETVVGVRKIRQSDPFFKRITAHLFYKIFNLFSDTKIIPHAGDFRLLDRKVINAFLALPERTRFNKGLFAWLGFYTYTIHFERLERAVGQSKWGYKKLFQFAMDGITSFSSVPLKIWGYIGIIVAAFSLMYAIFIVLRTLFLGIDIPGYASLIVVILFFGGINMMSVGILGEYMSRIFMESKQRPLYIVRSIYENSSE